MTTNSVYALGNALVDYEIEVDEAFLENAGIEKGVMTLVEEQQQQETLQRASGNQHSRTCGGSAANTIIGVAQLGGKAHYSCKVADDETGEFFTAALIELGVSSNVGDSKAPGNSGKCIVMVTPDADRTMHTCLGISAELSRDEVDEQALSESQYLYIEGYLVTSDSARDAAIYARELAEKHHVKTAFTLSDPGMASFFADGMKEMLGDGVDLLFCNEEEALTFSGTETLDEAIPVLQQYAKQLAITRGAKGAVLFDGTNTIAIETPQVTPVDTNGAGDLFSGGFLYGITHGMDFKAAGELACHLSSKLVTQFGARLRAEQAQEIFSELTSS